MLLTHAAEQKQRQRQQLAQRSRAKAQSKTQTKGSAVQKVIEMLGEMKAKVKEDIEVETKTMEEFMAYCDDEAKDKEYAIKTAKREIADASAVIEESSAKVIELEDLIATLGTEISAKEKELADASAIRKSEKADFDATEAELAKSVDELSRAIVEVKKGRPSFLQIEGKHVSVHDVNELATTLSKVVES